MAEPLPGKLVPELDDSSSCRASNTAHFGEFLGQPDDMTYAYDIFGQVVEQVFPNEVASE